MSSTDAVNVVLCLRERPGPGEVSHVIRFSPPLRASESGTIIRASSYPGLAEAGLEWFRVIKDNGWVYGYRFSCSNNKPCTILVTDGEPDTYSLSMLQCREHHVDYNSKNPHIHSIQFKK
jgi:hypothetical protein